MRGDMSLVAHLKINNEWIKTAAALACDWCGKPVRYDTLAAFASDMMRHGMLEAVDAK